MASKKLFSSYSVNIITFLVCLIAFKACITSAVQTLKTKDEIRQVLSSRIDKKKTLVLLSDFDGTLSNHVPNPKDAKLLPEAKAALANLASNKRVCVGIISGRLMEEVCERIPIGNVIFAGNHGREVLYPNGRRYEKKMDPKTQAAYDQLVGRLEHFASENNGTNLENKKYSLTFHYRNTPDNKHEYLKKTVKEIIRRSGFKADDAVLAVEGKPIAKWDKDDVTLQILTEEFGKDWKKKVNVIYAGDDVADELVMGVLKGCGVTFRVSKESISTHGDYILENPQTVAVMLSELVKIMEKK